MRTFWIGERRCRGRLGRRTGNTQVQTGVILALIALGVVVAVRSLGTNTSDKIASTATGVGNPAALVGGFSGSASSSSGSSGSGNSDSSSSGDSGSGSGSTGGDTSGGVCP